MGLTALGAGLLSGGMAFLGAGAQAVYNSREAQKDREFQEKMYHQQVADSIKFWEMNNQYNLPSAQRQRIEDANLNPYLMYSGGNVQNVATSAPQSATAPHGSKASANFNLRLDAAQLALLDAQKDNLEADSMKKINEGLKASAEKVKAESEYNWNLDTWQLRKDAMLADTRLKTAYENTEVSKRNEIEAHIKKAEAEIDYMAKELEFRGQLTAQEVKESDQRIANSIKETSAAVAKMDAEARKAEADAVYARAMGAIVGAPEYKRAALKQKAEELRKAINEGNLSAIEAGMAAWIYDQKPEIGSNAYQYRKWIDHWITPVTESLGKILGGSATYSFPTRKH